MTDDGVMISVPISSEAEISGHDVDGSHGPAKLSLYFDREDDTLQLTIEVEPDFMLSVFFSPDEAEVLIEKLIEARQRQGEQ